MAVTLTEELENELKKILSEGAKLDAVGDAKSVDPFVNNATLGVDPKIKDIENATKEDTTIPASEEGDKTKKTLKEDGSCEADCSCEKCKVVEESFDADKIIDSISDLSFSKDVDAIFNGETLTEDFKHKASTIFEAALKTQIKEKLTLLKESFDKIIVQKTKTIEEAMADKLSSYLDLVVEEWTKENEVAIESGLRTELTEDFMIGLKNLFLEHNIDIPEEKISIVEEYADKFDELEKKHNKTLQESVESKKEIAALKKEKFLLEYTKSMTDIDASKLKNLAEGIEFKDVESFKKKIEVLKESYLKKTVETLNEEVAANTNEFLNEEKPPENKGTLLVVDDPMINSAADYLKRIK